jgi:hypothetical protein
MKLSDQQVDKVRETTGLNPYPEDAPAADELRSHFGDHTFYLDTNGLYIWEEEEGAADSAARPATAVQIAAVTKDANGTPALMVVEPQKTSAVVDLAEA